MNKNKKLSEEQKEIIAFVMDDLQKRGLIKANFSTFKNTEIILRNYNKLSLSIKLHKEQIKDLKLNGLQKSSSSIKKIVKGAISQPDEEQIINSTILRLQNNIIKTKAFLKHIDRTIEQFKNDPYFEIIKKYYIDGKTLDDIAEYYDVKLNKKDSKTSLATIKNNKNRLINELKMLLFPNDVLLEFMGY